jgi:16S rRNA C967 or C1407 C5-methylase (RsmB/RsmF family)/NOL1/NOP2/fmu family ribosome biogenesis protein
MVDNLPPLFVSRMRTLLEGDADAFLNSFSLPPSTGLRVNTLKLSPGAFRAISPFLLKPVPWCAEGFLVTGTAQLRPGHHPYHAAGLYYLQDPSAMAVAALLDPQPGELALDLCAAPGGKATHIAARLQYDGVLVANEVVRDRTSVLVANLEQFGAPHILVASETVEALVRVWAGAFDRVVVDAPCSGEGLFHKNPAACLEWTPAASAGCAVRQDAILANAADLVRPGGRLVYATCTFAPEENEAVVARFLCKRADFELLRPPALPGFSPGRPDWIGPQLARGLPLERCVRIWPHRAPGEGHFIAILGRAGNAATRGWSAHPAALAKKAADIVESFWHAALTRELPATGWHALDDTLHWLPVSADIWRGLHVVRTGWQVGALHRNHFVPSHALAMALRAEDARWTVALRWEMPEVEAYLKGHTLKSPGPDGWLLITVDGFPLGWGKRVQGVVKNHYPHHLRWRS